jgi:hypothetical protein
MALLFTAAELAAAMGRKRESVVRTLASVDATGAKVVAGNEARAWSVESLPESLRKPLEEQSRQNGCRDVATYLRQCGQPWAPPLPLAECHADTVGQATRLREALRPALARQDYGLTAAEFEEKGVEDYRRVFGYGITPRRWRDKLTRTLRRAGTTHDLGKLELYLPDMVKAQAPRHVVKSQGPPDETRERLASFLPALSDPTNPSGRDREAFWSEVMTCHEDLVIEGIPHQRAGRQVRTAVFAIAPWIATGPEALQKAFVRKLAAWRESRANGMTDKRRFFSGNRSEYELPEADRITVAHLAVWHFHGHLAAGWRAARQRGLLTSETVDYFRDGASKSHVPRLIRDAVGPEVKIFMRMKRHQRSASDLVPHVTRTYEGIASGAVFNADDFTMPVYFTVPNRDGWFDLVRGQLLVFIDLRSSKIIGWSFQQDPAYSSLVIRSLCTHIFSELCLPKVLYFERGIWQRSTLITGSNPDGAMPWAEVKQGLHEFGIEFVHAIRPRSKPVERVGGLLQDLMEGEPGYCGRDERRDLPAHTKRAMDDVKFKRRRPDGLFYSFDQWHTRLGEIIATYNATAQEGRLDGLSPNRAFDQFMDPNDPPTQLGPELRHLLAHHKEEREVKTSGLQFKVGKNVFRYYGPELARLVGRRVLAWFDPENPDALVVTDLDRRNPVLIARAHEVSAMASLTGGTELLESELSRAYAQTAHLRAFYNVVKGDAPLPHRAVRASRSVRETGETITKLRAAATRKQRTAGNARRVAAEIGAHVPEQILAEDRTAQSLRAISDFLKEPREQTKQP